MNIKKADEIRGVELNTPPPPASVPPTVKRDRVSVDSSLQEAVAAGAAKASVGRAARMKELEHAIKTGQYRPSASQLAEQLLTQAEIDARMRAMLAGSG